jgi:hypothetical protein
MSTSSSIRAAARGSSLVAAAALVSMAAVASGCRPAQTATAATPPAAAQTPEEKRAAIEKWMGREVAPVGMQTVELLDGLATGEIESRTPLKPECVKNDAGGTGCSFQASLATDEAGLESTVVCTVSTELHPFGLVLGGALQGAGLDEAPTLQTRRMGEGIAATFVANTAEKKDDETLFGTAKIAALFAHGYEATCVDLRAGGRKTFERVAGHFFESLKFKDNPGRPVVFAFGYQVRVGERTSGLRYNVISRRQDGEAGFVETSTHAWVETDGKTWSVRDGAQVVERDPRGGVEKMQNLYWRDGKGPMVLSAKASEDRKFRLKLDAGDKSTGIESTPKAPLNTELWAAPELLRVATGSSRSYRYAFLDVLDSDPSFHYLTLTRSAPGVLLEDQEALAGPGHAAQASDSKDELHVDARGLVTKEVSTDSVSELIYTWGTLPTPLAGHAKAKVGHGR